MERMLKILPKNFGDYSDGLKCNHSNTHQCMVVQELKQIFPLTQTHNLNVIRT